MQTKSRWPHLLLAVLLVVGAGSVFVPNATAAAGDVILNPGASTLTVNAGGFFNVAGNNIVLPSTATPTQCNDGTNNDIAVDDPTKSQDTNIDFDGGASHGVVPVTPVDAQCAGAADDSEVKAGSQARQYVTMSGNVDKDGNISVPQAGISFPTFYVFSAAGGAVDIIPTATGPATGTLDPATGKSTLHVDWQLNVFQSFFHINCVAQVSMDLSTDPADPANSGPIPVSPVGYNPSNGNVTISGNQFTVGSMVRNGVVSGTTGSITAGSTTFTDPNANFTAADVGKTMNIDGAGAAGAVLTAGIQSRTDAHTVVLKTAASTTVGPTTYDYADSVQSLCNTVASGFGLPAAAGSSAAQLTAVSSTLFVSGQTPRITGNVTESGTGNPVSGVAVTLFHDYPAFTVQAGTTTDASGNYHFYQVPAGAYRIRFWDFTHQMVWWGDTLTYKDGTTVNVAANGSVTADQVMPTLPPGTLAGGAYNSTKAGLPSVVVQVFHSTGGFVTARQMDANGHYVVQGLPAGTYYLRFIDGGGTYGPQWYNFKASGFKADPVVIGSGVVWASALMGA